MTRIEGAEHTILDSSIPKWTFNLQEAKSALILPAVDNAIHTSILSLRATTEKIGSYRKVKRAAEDELKDVPGDIVSRLLKRSENVIRNLPTGHSVGHASRDLVHLTEVFQDPLTVDYDDVEILVGIIGGLSHDYGNGLISRSGERNRLVYHAEVGAWYAGEAFKNLLPPNLLSLVQLAIAAHTKLPNKTDVYRDGIYVGTREPYDTDVIIGKDGKHDRRGLALTWTACRGDIISAIMPVRHIPFAMHEDTVVLATGDVRHTDGMNTRDNVLDLFTLNPDHTTSLLNFFRKVAVNSTDPNNWHNIDDTPYITNTLYGESVLDLMYFFGSVLMDPPKDIDVQSETERFFDLCHLLEPGVNEVEVIGNARRDFFQYLPIEIQKHWAAGFKLLAEDLYPSFYNRMQENAANLPPFAEKRSKLIHDVVVDVHERAGRVLNAIDPKYLEGSVTDYPDVVEALAA